MQVIDGTIEFESRSDIELLDKVIGAYLDSASGRERRELESLKDELEALWYAW